MHSEPLTGYSVITIPKKVRRVSIRVGPDRTVRVTLPHGIDPAPYLEKNRRWIAEQAREIEGIAASSPGCEHHLLIDGQPCSLSGGGSCTLDREAGEATYTTPAAFRNYLIRTLRADLADRIQELSPLAQGEGNFVVAHGVADHMVGILHHKPNERGPFGDRER